MQCEPDLLHGTQVNYWPSNVEHTDETAAKRFPPSTKAVESGHKVRTDLPKAMEDPLYDFRQPGTPIKPSALCGI